MGKKNSGKNKLSDVLKISECLDNQIEQKVIEQVLKENGGDVEKTINLLSLLCEISANSSNTKDTLLEDIIEFIIFQLRVESIGNEERELYKEIIISNKYDIQKAMESITEMFHLDPSSLFLSNVLHLQQSQQLAHDVEYLTKALDSGGFLHYPNNSTTTTDNSHHDNNTNDDDDTTTTEYNDVADDHQLYKQIFDDDLEESTFMMMMIMNSVNTVYQELEHQEQQRQQLLTQQFDEFIAERNGSNNTSSSSFTSSSSKVDSQTTPETAYHLVCEVFESEGEELNTTFVQDTLFRFDFDLEATINYLIEVGQQVRTQKNVIKGSTISYARIAKCSSRSSPSFPYFPTVASTTATAAVRKSCSLDSKLYLYVTKSTCDSNKLTFPSFPINSDNSSSNNNNNNSTNSIGNINENLPTDWSMIKQQLTSTLSSINENKNDTAHYQRMTSTKSTNDLPSFDKNTTSSLIGVHNTNDSNHDSVDNKVMITSTPWITVKKNNKNNNNNKQNTSAKSINQTTTLHSNTHECEDDNYDGYSDEYYWRQQAQQEAQQMIQYFQEASTAAHSGLRCKGRPVGMSVASHIASQGHEAKIRFIKAEHMCSLYTLQNHNPCILLNYNYDDFEGVVFNGFDDGCVYSNSRVKAYITTRRNRHRGMNGSSSATTTNNNNNHNAGAISVSVDFHGLNVRQALRILKSIILFYRSLFIQQQSSSSYSSTQNQSAGGTVMLLIRIVVGIGTHSERGLSKLRPSVVAYLERQHIVYSIDRGEIVMVCR